MKPSILILASMLISYSGFAQTEKSIDSLLINQNTNQNKVIIRCGGTSIDNQHPMYIIDGVLSSSKALGAMDPENIESIEVLKGLSAIAMCGTGGSNGVVLITTNDGQQKQSMTPKKYAFKVYEIPNKNWTTQQYVYNAISAKVPSLQIPQTINSTTPTISMRGDDTTIVIVDGVRYDASILNILNPANIESVKVSNFPGAQNYFINE